MNTNNIYYGVLRVSTNIKTEGSYFLDGITTTTESVGVKPVLVLMKKGILGKTIIKDLNTNEKYMIKVPLEKGKLFIKIEQLVSFNICEKNSSPKLSKKEVLEIGNKGLDEIRNHLDELLELDGKQKVK